MCIVDSWISVCYVSGVYLYLHFRGGERGGRSEGPAGGGEVVIAGRVSETVRLSSHIHV